MCTRAYGERAYDEYGESAYGELAHMANRHMAKRRSIVIINDVYQDSLMDHHHGLPAVQWKKPQHQGLALKANC